MAGPEAADAALQNEQEHREAVRAHGLLSTLLSDLVTDVRLLPELDEGPVVALDPVSILGRAEGPMLWLFVVLFAGLTAVWVIAVVKSLQLGRWNRAQDRLELAVERLGASLDPRELERTHRDALGASLLLAQLAAPSARRSMLDVASQRAMVAERKRASVLMTPLATLGAISPLLGLLGTVYGIMEAFLWIGQTKTASLVVVGPAMGEALLTTAIGLAAAIPAVVAYNLLARRIDNLLERVEASARSWARDPALRAAHKERLRGLRSAISA